MAGHLLAVPLAGHASASRADAVFNQGTQ